MKRCRIFVAFFLAAVIVSSYAYGALRMNSRNFAVLCSKGSLQEVQQALDAGAKPTEQVLITAAYSNPYPEVIRLLISSAQRFGLDFRKMQVIGSTILNSAIRGGRPEVVRAIMSFGVNVNAKDRGRVSPMSEALRYGYKSDEPGRQEIIRILRDAGARR